MEKKGQSLTDQIYWLFKRNLPEIERGEQTVRDILNDSENHLILSWAEDNLAGVSVVNGSTVYLLCVDKPFQNRGIGTALLQESEDYVASSGIQKLVLGTGKEYIMPGVPMNRGAHLFFQKKGYRHSWGEMSCYDMEQRLDSFDYCWFSFGDTVDGVIYRLAVPEDLERVVGSITHAEPKFLRYYRNSNFYQKGTQRPILIAETEKEVVGALLLYISDDGEMGSVGATAVKYDQRHRGIATNLVRLGTKYLKELGLKRACLGYTSSKIAKIYERAGYRVSMEYFMGEKELPGFRE